MEANRIQELCRKLAEEAKGGTSRDINEVTVDAPDLEAIASAFDDAEKFILDYPDTIAPARLIQECDKDLRLPFPICYLEPIRDEPKKRHAFIFIEPTDEDRVFDGPGVEFHGAYFDLGSSGLMQACAFRFDADRDAVDLRYQAIGRIVAGEKNISRLADTMWNFLVWFIHTTTQYTVTYETVSPTISQKSQRQRAARGLGPLFEYKMVRIGDRVVRQGNGTGMGSPKAHHLRRGHYRHLKSGKVVWVKSFFAGRGRKVVDHVYTADA